MRHLYHLVVVILFVLPLSVFAQEQRSASDVLRYGDAVEGTIDNDRFEVYYEFAGQIGDVLILEVTSLAEGSEFQWPEVTLVSNTRGILADSNQFVSIDRSVVASVLPYTGDYEIRVSRDDGIAGEGSGRYMLRVIQPESLLPGETVSGSVRNDRLLNYYAVQQPGFFSVYYEFTRGELDPYIDAFRVDSDGELVEIGQFNGRELVSATIGLNGADSDVNIITIGDSFYAYYFDDRVETADYNLRLLVND